MTRKASEGQTSREDLRSTLSSFQDGLRAQVDDRRQAIVTVATVVVVTLVVVSYLVGRRGGRRRSTLVEIRRV